jgi:hypothetical protein
MGMLQRRRWRRWHLLSRMHHSWMHMMRRVVWRVMGWMAIVMLRIWDRNIDWNYCPRWYSGRNLDLHAFDYHVVARKE